MNWIKTGSMILFISLVLWFGIDFLFTKVVHTTGFSKFFTHDSQAGRINKPGFKGSFGGPLEDYFSSVSIGQFGERNSSIPPCDFINQKIIFLGDSSTAGFEVDDNETFVSLINQSCNAHLGSGVNFGVRASDTHMVLALYEKINRSISHNKIFYLISSNDFDENVDRFAYSAMTERFGRVFNGQLISPISEFSVRGLYLSFKVFFGDKFYLTTRFIFYFQSFVKKFFSQDKNYLAASDQEFRFNKMAALLNNLAVRASDEKIDLYIAVYPDLSEGRPMNFSVSYEEMLLKKFKNHPSRVRILELEKYIEGKSKLGCLQRSDMRFRNDAHLSKLGHKIISDFLRVELLNDETLTLESLCYK